MGRGNVSHRLAFAFSYRIMSLHTLSLNSDASRTAVDQALTQGKRIALVPGGIAEIFEGYPKPGQLPNEEYAIVRKGFMRLAL
jgi:hypothetical protein